MLIQSIFGLQRIVTIECDTGPISIEKIIFDFEHRSAIADMPPLRCESRIQYLVVHTLKTSDLIRQCGFIELISIKKM